MKHPVQTFTITQKKILYIIQSSPEMSHIFSSWFSSVVGQFCEQQWPTDRNQWGPSCWAWLVGLNRQLSSLELYSRGVNLQLNFDTTDFTRIKTEAFSLWMSAVALLQSTRYLCSKCIPSTAVEVVPLLKSIFSRFAYIWTIPVFGSYQQMVLGHMYSVQIKNQHQTSE